MEGVVVVLTDERLSPQLAFGSGINWRLAWEQRRINV